MQTMRLALISAAMVVMGAVGSGCVVQANTCAVGLTNCGGYCADLSSDETDCGVCGGACNIGDFCSEGLCIVGSCIADDNSCNHNSDCCSDFCASDGNCGCIPTAQSGCASDNDCCSGNCAHDGVCDP